MEVIELLENSNPDYAKGFVQTALRFYAEAITTGSPNAYFNKLADLNYPGISRDKAEELKLATFFIDWHDRKVTDLISAQTGISLGENLNEEQIDARAEQVWLQELELLTSSTD